MVRMVRMVPMVMSATAAKLQGPFACIARALRRASYAGKCPADVGVMSGQHH